MPPNDGPLRGKDGRRALSWRGGVGGVEVVEDAEGVGGAVLLQGAEGAAGDAAEAEGVLVRELEEALGLGFAGGPFAQEQAREPFGRLGAA